MVPTSAATCSNPCQLLLEGRIWFDGWDTETSTLHSPDRQSATATQAQNFAGISEETRGFRRHPYMKCSRQAPVELEHLQSPRSSTRLLESRSRYFRDTIGHGLSPWSLWRDLTGSFLTELETDVKRTIDSLGYIGYDWHRVYLLVPRFLSMSSVILNKFVLPQKSLMNILGTSLMVQWLRLWASTAGTSSLIPGWGTKIPQATWCGQKTKKHKNQKTTS